MSALAGALLSTLGSWGSGAGNFTRPTGLTLDAARRLLFVCDHDNHRVQCLLLSPCGLRLQELRWQFGLTRRLGAGPTLLYRPLFCALTPDRACLYVVDSGNTRVVVLRADSGQFVSAFGSRGSGAAQLASPTALAFAFAGAQRHVWLADPGHHRVLCFDAHDVMNHRLLRQVGRGGAPGSSRLNLDRPSGVTVHGGRLFVADSGNNRVQVFDEATGDWLQTLRGAPSSSASSSSSSSRSTPTATPSSPTSTGVTGVTQQQPRMVEPRLIAIDAAHQLAFVSDAHNFVAVFSLATLSFRGRIALKSVQPIQDSGSAVSSGISSSSSSAFELPAGLAVDTLAGLLYVCDPRAHRVVVYRSWE